VWGGSDLDVGCAVLVAALGSEQSDAVDAANDTVIATLGSSFSFLLHPPPTTLRLRPWHPVDACDRLTGSASSARLPF